MIKKSLQALGLMKKPPPTAWSIAQDQLYATELELLEEHARAESLMAKYQATKATISALQERKQRLEDYMGRNLTDLRPNVVELSHAG